MSWDEVKLGEVADVNWGDTSVTKKSYIEKGHTAYSAAGPDGMLSYYDYDREAIILSAIGARCGKTWFASGKWSCIKNTIRFWSESEKLDNRFLYWLTFDEDFFPKRGAGQPFITIGNAREVKIPLPPLPEQKRIAAILDQADELRRQRQSALEHLNQLGQSIFYEMFGDPRVNKHRFATVKLSEIIRKDDKINYGVVQPGSDFDSGVPLIRAADISVSDFSIENAKKIDPEIEKKYSRSRLRGDEILIACVGSVGATCLARSNFKGANIARAVSRVPIEPNLANREFIYEQIKTPAIQNYFTSEIRAVAQPTLNIKHIKETKIILPSLKQQNDFSTVISKLEGRKEKYIHAALNSNTLFASLQQRAFRGEL